VFGERRPLGLGRLVKEGALLAAVLVAAGPAWGADRVTIGLSGLFAPDRIELQGTRTFTEYAEAAALEWSVEQDSGWGAEGAIEAHLGRSLGVELAVSAVRRDGVARAALSIPHPFYLNRPRTGSVEEPARYEERAVHVGAVYRARRGRLLARLSGGASIFRISQDLVEDAAYDEAYPFDEIAVRELVLRQTSDRAFGFNVGGEIGLRVAGQMALAGGVRYSRGRVSLSSPAGQAVSVDAGGLQVRFGLRLTL
jgi:hypothetical protein